MAEATPALTTTATGEHSPADEAEQLRLERILLIIVALSVALAPLNSTMIAVALPRIVDALNANVATAGWLVTGYLIAIASLQPVAGKLGDKWGRRPMILGGLAYFGIVSLGATVAPNLPLLLFFRIQQGIAGAIVFPNGAALLRDLIPAQRRATRFGLLGAIVSIAAAGGPPLGGLLVGTTGWRSIFLMNIPLLLPALLLGYRYIPKAARRTSATTFDLLGAFLLSVTLICAAWLLNQSRNAATAILLPGALFIVIMIAFFIYHEHRHPDPLIQPHLFRHRSFAAGCATIALSNLAMYNTMLAVPILLAQRAGWTELRIGLALTALSAASVIFSPIGGRLADKFGRRKPVLAGLLLSTVGFALLVLPGAPQNIPLLLTSLTISGIGLGLSSSGLQTATVEAVAPNQAGVASGIFSTSRYLGSIVGSSILAALIANSATTEQFTQLFLIVLIAAALATAASLALHDHPIR